MNNIPSLPSPSDDLKPVLSRVEGSKACGELRRIIENLKWVGILAIVLTLVLGGARAEAQPTKNISRLGYLDPGRASGNAVLMDAFRQELRKLGWIEGKSITIEYRFAENKGSEHLIELAADLVRLKVDLILASGAGSVSAAKSATTTIPIVMVNTVDPVTAGFVDSLARPGGNVTGIAIPESLGTKRLEVLKDAVPKLDRVGVLRPPGANIAGDPQLKELRPAALALKLKLEEIETQADPEGLESAFQTARQKKVGAIMTIATRAFFAERKRIVELAGKYRLPAAYPSKEFVEVGGLMSYGADVGDSYRRVGIYIDKILKGAKPADLPVQQATKFELIINLKAAKEIGLAIPLRVLEHANQVIK